MLSVTKISDSQNTHLNNTCHERLETYTSKAWPYTRGEKNVPQITESTQQHLLNIANNVLIYITFSTEEQLPLKYRAIIWMWNPGDGSLIRLYWLINCSLIAVHWLLCVIWRLSHTVHFHMQHVADINNFCLWI
jgi:hypothetical protein